MYAAAQKALAEIDCVLHGVDEAQIEELLNCLIASGDVLVYGLGREGLVMRSFAMRLMHLGVKVAVVGDVTAPPAQPGTLLLVSCGPGYLSTVDALAGVAQAAGATVFMVTAQPQAALPQRADRLLVLPAQTMVDAEGSGSEQAMGSVFEQALWILFDALIPDLQRRLGQSTDDLRRRHTNLE